MEVTLHACKLNTVKTLQFEKGERCITTPPHFPPPAPMVAPPMTAFGYGISGFSEGF